MELYMLQIKKATELIFLRFNNTGDLTYLNTIKSNLLSFLKDSFKLMSGFIFSPHLDIFRISAENHRN